MVNSIESLSFLNKFSDLPKNVLSFNEEKTSSRNSWVKLFGLYGVADLTKSFSCSTAVVFLFILFSSFAMLLFSQRPCVFVLPIK